MPTITAGQQATIDANAGETLRVQSDAQGSGKVWFTGNGLQDVLAASIAASADLRLGPYIKTAGVRIECVTGSITYTENIGNSDPAPLNQSQMFGALIKQVSGATYTLANTDAGFMLLFAQACTVTIPKGLRSNFSCGWSQESAGAVTFAAGAGVTLTSKGGGLASAAQYSTGGLAAFAQDVYRLMGV